jgi:hypothetical protein
MRKSVHESQIGIRHGMSAKASAGPIMVLQHLCAHGRRRGFRLIHACQSALLGGRPCLTPAGGGRAGYASHHASPLCHVLQGATDGYARLPGQTCAGRSVVIVGRAQRGEVQDVHGRRVCRPP